MSLKIFANGGVSSISIQSFDDDAHAIICEPDDGAFASVLINYPLTVDKKHDPKKFKLYLLRKKDLKEDDIYQVYDRTHDTRVGWCFPIQALCSKEHSFASNEYFLQYAYVAAIRLFNDIDDRLCNAPDVTENPVVYFSDFFPEFTAVLVISLDNVQDAGGFNCDEWLPSLFRYGYVLSLDNDNKKISYNGFEVTEQRVRLNIYPVSSYVGNRVYIDNAFKSLMPYESNYLLLFFYQYQIIELLMGQVLSFEQKKYIDQLVRFSNDTVKAKEIIDKIDLLHKEKKRIALLLNNYIRDMGSLQIAPLLVACNKLLMAVGKEENRNLHESLYQVRNTIFHQYHNIDTGNTHVILEEICREFSHLLTYLVTQFEPKEIHEAEVDG